MTKRELNNGIIIMLIRVSARCILKKTDPAEVAAACDKLDLEVERVKDELDLSGIYDIYNRRSFGVTEADIVASVFGGVKKVIEMEKKREADIEWKSGR